VSHNRSTYDMPEGILADLEGVSQSDRTDLIAVWSMISDEPAILLENGKDRVRNTVMENVLNSRPSRLGSVRPPRQPVARIFAMKLRMTALAAAIVVGLSFSLSPPSQQYRASVGSVSPTLVSLADGSTVSLSPGSRLSVPNSFGKQNRRVILNGQGFLEVTPSAVPFEVVTFDAVTQVLGTSFSVKAWPGASEASTQVVVKTGRVSVSGHLTKVLVNPGEMTTISLSEGTPSTPAETDLSSNLFWTGGGFYFDQELVDNVIKEVERRFDVRINAPTSIKLRRFSYAKIAAADAGEVIGDLAATIGVRYRPTANGFELYLQ
jgi:ferric-dicitrate binding protein FerR (iron transport regulator)